MDAALPLIWQRTMWNYLIFSSCVAVKMKAESREGAAVEHIRSAGEGLESHSEHLISSDFPPTPVRAVVALPHWLRFQTPAAADRRCVAFPHESALISSGSQEPQRLRNIGPHSQCLPWRKRLNTGERPRLTLMLVTRGAFAKTPKFLFEFKNSQRWLC